MLSSNSMNAFAQALSTLLDVHAFHPSIKREVEHALRDYMSSEVCRCHRWTELLTVCCGVAHSAAS